MPPCPGAYCERSAFSSLWSYFWVGSLVADGLLFLRVKENSEVVNTISKVQKNAFQWRTNRDLLKRSLNWFRRHMNFLLQNIKLHMHIICVLFKGPGWFASCVWACTCTDWLMMVSHASPGLCSGGFTMADASLLHYSTASRTQPESCAIHKTRAMQRFRHKTMHWIGMARIVHNTGSFVLTSYCTFGHCLSLVLINLHQKIRSFMKINL